MTTEEFLLKYWITFLSDILCFELILKEFFVLVFSPGVSTACSSSAPPDLILASIIFSYLHSSLANSEKQIVRPAKLLIMQNVTGSQRL